MNPGKTHCHAYHIQAISIKLQAVVVVGFSNNIKSQIGYKENILCGYICDLVLHCQAMKRYSMEAIHVNEPGHEPRPG